MKKKMSAILCLIGCILLVGCAQKKQADDTEPYIYYFNTEEKILEKAEYQGPENSAEKEINAMLEEMKNTPEALELQSVIPKGVEIESFSLQKDQLELHFNDAYRKMKKGQEVLCRAAVVQTLVQIDEVSFVSFYVEDEPLKDSKGVPIGLMRAEDFVQNTGSSLNNYQTTTLNLYFANEDGTKLSNEKVSDVHYSSNTSIEKLIVEQLMKGPASGNASPTIPKAVKLLGVSIKDGICYVNFDSSFLTEGYNQKPEVPIYSIVNSIIEGGNASQVQILVDGSSDVVFKESIKLDRPFEWNADLIEEQEED